MIIRTISNFVDNKFTLGYSGAVDFSINNVGVIPSNDGFYGFKLGLPTAVTFDDTEQESIIIELITTNKIYSEEYNKECLLRVINDNISDIVSEYIGNPIDSGGDLLNTISTRLSNYLQDKYYQEEFNSKLTAKAESYESQLVVKLYYGDELILDDDRLYELIRSNKALGKLISNKVS